MSSMKSFKSRLSQKRSSSRIKVEPSLNESIVDYNLKNLFMNVMDSIQFRLQKHGDKINIAPSILQLTNNTGARIFLHVVATKQEYFSITPKKYILQNGNTLNITIKLIQVSYVQLQDYESESFQISWGRISEQEIANKIIPTLTESSIFKCILTNKNVINQFLAKKTYEVLQHPVLDPSQNKNFLSASNFSMDKRQQFVRSGLNASDLNLYTQRPSLLRMNVIVAVSVVSFIIGFLSA